MHGSLIEGSIGLRAMIIEFLQCKEYFLILGQWGQVPKVCGKCFPNLKIRIHES